MTSVARNIDSTLDRKKELRKTRLVLGVVASPSRKASAFEKVPDAVEMAEQELLTKFEPLLQRKRNMSNIFSLLFMAILYSTIGFGTIFLSEIANIDFIAHSEHFLKQMLLYSGVGMVIFSALLALTLGTIYIIAFARGESNSGFHSGEIRNKKNDSARAKLSIVKQR